MSGTEEFVLAYVDFFEGLTFEDAYAMAVERDALAASEFLWSIERNMDR